ncbi:uncharacterized protein LOC143043384 [Mytilus galloprovincialis]|uniref:uncharacterized protein LOC143043384 n=1 Tax=Mytilus galloprovincialis TaxID=29158 RepID=UPI003F7B8CE8
MEVVKVIFCVAFFEVYLLLTVECNGNQNGECSNNTSFEKFCCSGYGLKNGTCKKCEDGYYSERKLTCKKCAKGNYGDKCGKTCNCNSKEWCDHIVGCIPGDARIREENKSSHSNSKNPPTTSNNGDVVIYMTCVAVGSVFVVVGGLLVKNKEAICRIKSGDSSVKHIIHHFKQPCINDAHKQKDAERLYDEINEKYMINFDGE